MSESPATAERRARRRIGAAFSASALSAIGFSVSYWWGDSIQLEGLFAGLSFLFLAAGLVVWSHRLLPEGPFHEEYPEFGSTAREEAAVLASVDRGGVGRRRLLIGTFGVVGASLGAGALSSFRSLGPAPASLLHTAWQDRRILVTADGTPVNVADVPTNSIVTVFPAGFTASAQDPALLIHLPPGLNKPLPGRASWAPQNFICYSKVCSHAGCAVNLYNHEAYELQCPCHQSTFNVLRGARPVFGPAGGPLVQLPLAVDSDGTLRSTGDFSGPPGPVFWHRQ
jgi:ubiquinol-cytochrome c reductase iron-sulfur subunit